MLRRLITSLLVIATAVTAAHADNVPVLALTDLVMGEANDARKAIAIGPSGQVYEPKNGAWVRTAPIAIADRVSVVGRASGVVALADGAVYRLADNGWSAIRLHQKHKALMSAGARAVAVVGRQLFALDRNVHGEPMKLAAAPAGVTAIGAGAKSIVVATDRGLQRLTGTAWKAIAKAPRRVDRLLDDRFAIVDRGVVELDTGVVTPWPAGFRVGATMAGELGATAVKELTVEAAQTPAPARGKARPKAKAKPSALVVVAAGTLRGAPTLVVMNGGAVIATEEIEATLAATLDATRAKRDPAPDTKAGANGGSIALKTMGAPVGVVADRAGRVTVAFAKGAVAVREKGAWSAVAVVAALPPARPGAPPATGPK